MNKHKIIKGQIRKSSRPKDKFLCCSCLKSGKTPNPCGVSTHNIMRVSPKIRFPKHDAGKKRWLDAITKSGLLRFYNDPNYTSDYAIETKSKLKLLFKTLKIKI